MKSEFQMASSGKRFVAYILDFLAPLAVFIIALLTGLQVNPDESNLQALLIFIWWAYLFVAPLVMDGSTLGQKTVGIQYVLADGAALDPVRNLGRSLLFILIQIIPFLPLINVIPLFSKKKIQLNENRTYLDQITGIDVVNIGPSKTSDSTNDKQPIAPSKSTLLGKNSPHATLKPVVSEDEITKSIFETISNEIKTRKYDHALLLMATEQSNGNNELRNSIYLKLRKEKLRSEFFKTPPNDERSA